MKSRTFAAGISTTSTRLAGVIREDILDELVGTLLELVDDSVVQGILVLLEPASNVVGHLFSQKKESVFDETRGYNERTVPA